MSRRAAESLNQPPPKPAAVWPEAERRRMRELIRRARRAPFFRAKLSGVEAGAIVDVRTFADKVPLMRLEEIVSERRRSRDPYSGRWCGKEPSPLIAFQAEYDADSAIYLGMDRSSLQKYAVALERCWALFGLGRGDRVAIFDYGSSPISYLASAIFTPYLRRGAADALGCLPVCNDGVANMAPRAVEILKWIRPKLFFVRSDCLAPLAIEIHRQLPRLADYTSALAVAENEGVLSKEKQELYEHELRVPVYRLLRLDIAQFLAAECPQCRLLHSPPDLYHVESAAARNERPWDDGGEGALIVTNRFASSFPSLRYLSQVKGRLAPPGCPRRPEDQRIAV